MTSDYWELIADATGASSRELTGSASKHTGEAMARRAEIRPRKTKDGWDLDCGTLGLWYRSREHAISYAQDCMRDAEVFVYDEGGKVVECIPPRTVSNTLNSV